MVGFSSNSSNTIGALLNSAIKGANKSFKLLATGKNNSNGADLSVIADLEAAVKVNTQGARNASTSSLALSIADSSVSQLSGIQNRMQELATQSANGVYSDEQRQVLSEEFNSLREEAGRIVETTEFNGQKLFEGGSTSTQLGETSLALSNSDFSQTLSDLATLDISTQSGSQTALEGLDTFGSKLSASKSLIGANQTRLEVAENQLGSRAMEEQAAAASISDIDIAKEVASKISNNIKLNSASAIFASANLNQSKVMNLLRT
jgi:flagellin